MIEGILLVTSLQMGLGFLVYNIYKVGKLSYSKLNIHYCNELKINTMQLVRVQGLTSKPKIKAKSILVFNIFSSITRTRGENEK